MNMHLVTVGKKNSILTGRNCQLNQAHGGAATHHTCLGVNGK